MGRQRRNPADRFWAKVEKGEGCWLWTAATAGAGYGWFRGPNDRPVYAHRFAYELLVGPIPAGLTIDHLCGVRNCVNVDHMDLVTAGENTLRGKSASAFNAAKTHCPRGHLYDLTTAQGGRWCRTCRREAGAAAYRRHRGGVVGPANETKTHCPKGHPYSGINLRIDTNGARRCRACESDHNRNRKRRVR